VRMKNIYIIGVGQLGYRHAESFLNYSGSELVNITLVDKCEDRVVAVKDELNTRDKVGNVNFFASTHLPTDENISLAILSTNADVRFNLTNSLVKNNNVENVILEKIVFQAPHEYDEINNLFTRHHVSAWVNTPMRVYPFYKKLKAILEGSIEVKVNGSGWGLACNSIHFVDLLSYLSGECISDLDFSEDMVAINSKREGYLEYTGSIQVEYNKRCKLYLNCEQGDFNRIITISSKNVELKLDERNNKAEVNWLETSKSEEWQLNFPYQSQLTGNIFSSILIGDDEHLPKYSDVYEMHSKYIMGFCGLEKANNKLDSKKVNIT